MDKVSLSGDGVHMTSNAPHAFVKVPWNIMETVFSFLVDL